MSINVIPQGDADFVFETVMPSKWKEQPTSVNCDIYKTNGTQIGSQVAATIYTGDTLDSSGATAGQRTCTLTTGNSINDGQIVHIGSAVQGWQEREVDSYTAATKALILKTRFRENLAASSEVKGRNLKVTLDTTASDWDFIGEVTVVWSPVGISYSPITQTWKVRKRESASAGLETEFQKQFWDFAEHTKENFETFENSARAIINRQISIGGRDITRIVDSEDYSYLIMIQIALNICNNLGTSFDSRAIKLQAQKDSQLAVINDLLQWQDTNQDLIKTDSETQRASYGRGRNF